MGESLEKKMYYTREEYLSIEEQTEYKSEYYDGEIFAMSGGSSKHSIICVNLNWGIREALADKDCIGFDSNMKLDIASANAFVYPDAMVVCGDIEFHENRTDIIKNPVLIIEVLSPSTQAFDRGGKFNYYRTVSSLKEYVLVSQGEPMVEVYYKQDEKNWSYTVTKGLEDTVVLHSINYELALKDIYHKIGWNKKQVQHNFPNCAKAKL
ncbi:MAG: Uma2 family endonuclease [Desulfobacteraceae bacterium]|nr:Uma2 family endonuclease [Desulfobacteraceae bacterium]